MQDCYSLQLLVVEGFRASLNRMVHVFGPSLSRKLVPGNLSKRLSARGTFGDPGMTTGTVAQALRSFCLFDRRPRVRGIWAVFPVDLPAFLNPLLHLMISNFLVELSQVLSEFLCFAASPTGAAFDITTIV